MKWEPIHLLFSQENLQEPTPDTWIESKINDENRRLSCKSIRIFILRREHDDFIMGKRFVLPDIMDQ
jgi:hypothetical protein